MILLRKSALLLKKEKQYQVDYLIYMIVYEYNAETVDIKAFL